MANFIENCNKNFYWTSSRISNGRPPRAEALAVCVLILTFIKLLQEWTIQTTTYIVPALHHKIETAAEEELYSNFFFPLFVPCFFLQVVIPSTSSSKIIKTVQKFFYVLLIYNLWKEVKRIRISLHIISDQSDTENVLNICNQLT